MLGFHLTDKTRTYIESHARELMKQEENNVISDIHKSYEGK
jgi:hypothetical protein